MLATAAGLTPDHSSFRNFGAGGYFLPVQQLSKRYRSLFLEGIRQLNESEQLTFSGDAAALRNSYAWSELLNACYEKEWNVEIKKYQVHRAESGTAGSGLTADTFGRYVLHRPVSPEKVHHTNLSPASPVPSEDPQSEDPEADVVTEYFSQYAFRTAITDNRISSWNQRAVIFEYKRYHDRKCNRELMTVETGEFIRRFLLHILESGFQRIRYAGFLASCIRKKMLSIIRGILNLKRPNASNASCKKLKLAELVEQLTGINPSACPVCKGKINNIVHRIKIRELSSKGITNCYLRGS